jgi:hypothetical protein
VDDEAAEGAAVGRAGGVAGRVGGVAGRVEERLDPESEISVTGGAGTAGAAFLAGTEEVGAALLFEAAAGAGRARVVSSPAASEGSLDFSSDAFTVIGDAPPAGICRDVLPGR